MKPAVSRADRETSPDFVPPENRRQGLYLQTYKVNGKGERYGHTEVETVEDARGLGPALGSWPRCSCPRCRPV